MTKINKSELMKSAWMIKKEYNLTLSEALTEAWDYAKLSLTIENDIEKNGFSGKSFGSLDLVGAGTIFTDSENIRWEVLENKSYTTMTSDVDEEGAMIFGKKTEDDLFLCEMVDFGGPRDTFSRELIIELSA